MRPKPFLFKFFILSVSLSLFFSAIAFALPEGGKVESGEATFESPNPTTLNIHADNKAVINFNSFNIAQNEIVNFIQPSSTSSVLSRVVGNTASQIFGSLLANGILILTNPNGIHFAPSANVQVNTLLASTLEISTNNFINGNYIFEHRQGAPFSQILNEGNIAGNNIALIASAVQNTGLIQAHAGTVHLASGDKIIVSFDSRGLIQVEVNEATSGKVYDLNGTSVKDALANLGTIEGAQVIMAAKTAADIFKNAVNQAGIVRATKIVNEGGVIKIKANSDVQASGILDAKAGSVEITTEASIKVDKKLNTFGNAILSANKDILVNADITTDSGNLELFADNDFDGVGAFLQAPGTTISTLNFGDITIQASGLSTLANINSAGDLILKQAGLPVSFTQQTNSSIFTHGSLKINPGATLMGANANYNIGKDWSNLGNFIPGASTVSLVSFNEARVSGQNTFFNFSVTVPGKIVRFDSDNTQAILGALTLKGEYGKLLTLVSIDPAKQWSIDPQGQTDIQYALIGNALNIRGPPLEAIHSSSLGNNTNLDLDPYWTGQGTSNNWSDSNNWDTGTVPSAFDAVTFDGTSHNIANANPNKDSIIDSNFPGIISSFIISGYTGSITQQANLRITGDFTQTTGTFHSDPLFYAFSVGHSFSIPGGRFERYISGSYDINDIFGLQGINSGHLADTCNLLNDIDASVTSGWNGGAGFVPIGNNSTPFTGTFSGNGHTISNLCINTSASYAGLFGHTSSSASISNVGLVGGSVTGNNYVGALVGHNEGVINNSYNTGSVDGLGSYAGGLVGANSGPITELSYQGLLEGENEGVINNSYNTGSVSGDGNYTGGLVGVNGGSITDSYNTGSVNCNGGGIRAVCLAGLVGYNLDGGSITNSYNSGDVSGWVNFGAQGSSGMYYSGGLVGRNVGSITSSYSVGSISATIQSEPIGNGIYIGGLVGRDDNTITDCGWWTGSGVGYAIGSEGWYSDSAHSANVTYNESDKTAFYNQFFDFYGNWDFITTPVWDSYADTYPHLHNEGYGTPLTIITWTGNSSSSWNDIGNWSPNQVPGATSIAVIPSGTLHNLILDAGISIPCIKVDSGATLDFNGKNVTLQGSLTNFGTIRYNGSGTITLDHGNDSTHGTWEFYNTCSMLNYSYYDVNISAGTVSLPASYTGSIKGDLTISNGATFNSAGNDLTVGGNWDSSGGTFQSTSNTVTFIGSGKNIRLGSGNSFFDLANSGNVDLNGQDLTVHGDISNTGTIRYNSSGTITLDHGNDSTHGTWEFYGTGTMPNYSYYDINISGGTVSLPVSYTGVINDNLTISNGATFNSAGNDLTVGGNWDSLGGVFKPTSNTVTITGSNGGQIALGSGNNFFNLNIASSGWGWTDGSPLTVNNNLNIAADGNFDIYTSDLTVHGNVSNSGVFYIATYIDAGGMGTITLDHGNDSTHGTCEFYGDPATLPNYSYNNLNTYIDTMFLPASYTGVINGNLTIGYGTFDIAGNDLTVGGSWDSSGGTFQPTSNTVTFTGEGTITPGSGNNFFNLAIAGSASVQLLDVLPVNNNLANSGNLDLNGQSLIVGGALTNNGKLMLQHDESISAASHTDTGTVDYYGSGSYTGLNPFFGDTYHNLQLNSGTYIINNTLTVNGALTNNATLDLAGNQLNVGVFTNNGTISHIGTIRHLGLNIAIQREGESVLYINLIEHFRSVIVNYLEPHLFYAPKPTFLLRDSGINIFQIIRATHMVMSPDGTIKLLRSAPL